MLVVVEIVFVGIVGIHNHEVLEGWGSYGRYWLLMVCPSVGLGAANLFVFPE